MNSLPQSSAQKPSAQNPSAQQPSEQPCSPPYSLPPYCLKTNSIVLSAILRGEINLLAYLVNHICVDSADEKGITFLMYAAAEGNRDIVELFLKHGADVNMRRNDGSTALMFAISLERIDIVRLLIAYGADANICNHDGLYPIQLAVHTKNINIAKILIASGAKLNEPTKLQPALHRAVIQGNRELIYLFLRTGASMYLLNHAGVSAFGIAICNGDAKIVELFLKFNPDLRYAVDMAGNTALHAAAIFGRREIFTLLVEAGANIHLPNASGLTSLACLLSCACEIDENSPVVEEHIQGA